MELSQIKIKSIIILLFIIITIIGRTIILKKINKYIDKKFEEEFYNRTNKFTRFLVYLFSNKNKIKHEKTYTYRQNMRIIVNIFIISIISITIIALFFLKI